MTLPHSLKRRLLRDFLPIHVTRAASLTPATGQAPIFTVSGGRIRLVKLIGQVVQAFPATANNLSLTANPTVGSDEEISANLAMANREAGALLSAASFGAPLVGKNAGAVTTPLGPDLCIVAPGTIDWITSATSATGTIKWDLYFLSFDDGASVAAA